VTRLGIFGGSFDPVHNAHLAVARACQQQASLDAIWFTLTAIQPLKQHGPQATNEERVEMLHLAIDGEQSWRVCTLEVDRGGRSYSVDTLRRIREELPGAELFFPMGADAAREAPRWREPDEIFRLAMPLVVRRAGEAEPELTALKMLCPADHQPQLIEMASYNISSSEIRRRIMAGEALEELVPVSVARYIVEHALYRSQPSASS